MMLIHDASGAVAVVSAESVRIVGEGCIVLNARAVYIHNQALTSEQAAIVKRGVMATLDDPGGVRRSAWEARRRQRRSATTGLPWG